MSNVQIENLFIQPNENPNNDNNQDELQSPNPTLDTQSTALTVDSNAFLVPVRRVEEQNIRPNTEQDPEHLIHGSSNLSTTNTTMSQPPNQPPTSRNYDPPPHLNMIHILLLPHLNNQAPLMTIILVL